MGRRQEQQLGVEVAQALALLTTALDNMSDKLSAQQSAALLEPLTPYLAPRYALRIAEITAETAGGLFAPRAKTRSTKKAEFKSDPALFDKGRKLADVFQAHFLSLVGQGVDTREDLADRLEIRPMDVTCLVHYLEDQGWITVGIRHRPGRSPIQSIGLADRRPSAVPRTTEKSTPATLDDWRQWMRTKTGCRTLADLDTAARSEFGTAPDWSAVLTQSSAQ